MDIYITQFGTKLHKKGEAIAITTGDKEEIFSCDQVSNIIIQDKVSLSSDFMELAIKNDIPIFFSDRRGDIVGKVWETKFGSTAKIRRKQLEIFSTERGAEFAKKWILIKANKQKEHLIKLSQRTDTPLSEDTLRKIQEDIDKIAQISGYPDMIRNSLMGFEGNISKIYYGEISKILPSRWRFKGREHQNAKEPFNIVLNYLYGILYSKVEHSLVVAGLDPFIGIIHTDGYGKPALLFDFIEQFRFLAVEEATSLFTKKVITDEFFIKNEEGVFLESNKKKIIISEFYKKLEHSEPVAGNRTFTHRTYIDFIAKNLASQLMEEI